MKVVPNEKRLAITTDREPPALFQNRYGKLFSEPLPTSEWRSTEEASSRVTKSGRSRRISSA
jgi:hypothetical protein